MGKTVKRCFLKKIFESSEPLSIGAAERFENYSLKLPIDQGNDSYSSKKPKLISPVSITIYDEIPTPGNVLNAAEHVTLTVCVYMISKFAHISYGFHLPLACCWFDSPTRFLSTIVVLTDPLNNIPYYRTIQLISIE